MTLTILTQRGRSTGEEGGTAKGPDKERGQENRVQNGTSGFALCTSVLLEPNTTKSMNVIFRNFKKKNLKHEMLPSEETE